MNEVIQPEKQNAEARLAQAFIYAIQQDPDSPIKAEELFEEFEHSELLYIRYKLVQLLLLMGRGEEAKKRCIAWLDAEDSIGMRETEDSYYENCLRYVAGDVSALNTESAGPYEKLVAQYTAGLLAYADEEEETAIKWMAKCDQARVMGTERSWARALHSHWTKKKYVPMPLNVDQR